MSFTPEQLGAFIIALVGFALTVLNLIDKAMQLRAKAKEPQNEIEDRIERLEKWREMADLRFAEGNKHFARIDEGTKVTQQALLALIDDALSDNGNHDELKRARNCLYEYLSEK